MGDHHPNERRPAIRSALRSVWVRNRPRATKALAVALLGPGLVTLLALVPRADFAIAALAYVLAVVVASAVGGIGAGLVATFLSFLALNLLFTEAELDDLVALGVFVVVASIVGSVLATAIDQRARAERREEETRLLHHLGMRLIGGERIDDILRRFAEAITELFELARCEVWAEGMPSPAVVSADHAASQEREREVPIAVDGRGVGWIRAIPQAGRTPSQEEHHVMEMFAGQMGLALRGVRLAGKVARAESEAQMSRARSALFSSVTHDLRTPLASILGSATTLQDAERRLGSRERRDLVATIRQEAERLNRLVGNLLQLSRLRAGALVPARSPGSVEEVVEQVLSRLRPTLGEHRVRVDIDEDLPDVPIDVVHIDQVMTNLLENAAKMSPPGTEIIVSAHRSQRGVTVSVADEGPGIPPEEREIVFEPFVRGKDARGSGSGLGLTIARAIIEAHGGSLGIDGQARRGTTVRFELPLEDGQGEPDPGSEEGPS
jgi:two-component system sensor histidine kinase KdpD